MSERGREVARGVGLSCVRERECGSARDCACHSVCERVCARVCARVSQGACARVRARVCAAAAARGDGGGAGPCGDTRVFVSKHASVRAAVDVRRERAGPWASGPVSSRPVPAGTPGRASGSPQASLGSLRVRRGHVAVPAQSPSVRNASREVTHFRRERESGEFALMPITCKTT